MLNPSSEPHDKVTLSRHDDAIKADNGYYTPIFPISFDPETRQISVGKWVANKAFYNHPIKESHRTLKEEVLKANGVVLTPTVIRKELRHLDSEDYDIVFGKLDFNKQSSHYLGARFYAQLRKVTNDCVIDPIRSYLTRYCLYTRNAKVAAFHQAQIGRVWLMLPHIQWLERHGKESMIPLVIYFMLPPKELRRKLGEHLWKTLEASSRNRTNSLAFHLLKIDEYDGQEWSCSKTEIYRNTPLPDDSFHFRVERLKLWVTLKTVTLKQKLSWHNESQYSRYAEGLALVAEGMDFDVEEGQEYQFIQDGDKFIRWMDKYGTPSNEDAYNKAKHLLNDTRSMARRLGRTFEYCNLRQMKIRHDLFATIIRNNSVEEMKKDEELYHKDFFGIQEFIDEISLLDLPGVTVRVLKSRFDVVTEGQEQSHCVVNHIEPCKNLSMLMFSITSTQQRTTLGLQLHEKAGEPSSYRVYQHYGYDNEIVTCSFIKAAERKIAHCVNSILSIAEFNGSTKRLT